MRSIEVCLLHGLRFRFRPVSGYDAGHTKTTCIEMTRKPSTWLVSIRSSGNGEPARSSNCYNLRAVSTERGSVNFC